MKKRQAFVIATAILALAGCSTFEAGPVGNRAVPEPAKAVEVDRYLGRWYELARYEAGFQKDCEGVTADYSLTAPGQIKVINTCLQGSLQGKSKQANGKAKVVEGSQNAKLRVSFFGPFYGDYWVLDHAEDYSWSIVGEPSGRYLWLLHRQPNPGAATLIRMKARAAELGYDVGLLRVTQQPAS
jgi:apolipoprotein D and lipocalin family protein